MKKLTALQRQDAIMQLLSKNGAMRPLDLAEHFQVSKETIRKDLMVLTEDGRVRRWFGGVIRNDTEAQAPSIYAGVQSLVQGSDAPEGQSQPVRQRDNLLRAVDEKLKENADEKMLICKRAVELIPEGAIIFLDNGTTTMYLAEMLNARTGLTIITASIPVINICMNGPNKLIVCGGSIDPRIMSSTGSIAVSLLEQLKTDVAVFGSSGFKNDDGPTGNDLDYRKIKTTALRNTQKSIVLADSSKAEYSSLVCFAAWNQIDCLITDANLPPAVLEAISRETDVIIADAPSEP